MANMADDLLREPYTGAEAPDSWTLEDRDQAMAFARANRIEGWVILLPLTRLVAAARDRGRQDVAGEIERLRKRVSFLEGSPKCSTIDQWLAGDAPRCNDPACPAARWFATHYVRGIGHERRRQEVQVHAVSSDTRSDDIAGHLRNAMRGPGAVPDASQCASVPGMRRTTETSPRERHHAPVDLPPGHALPSDAYRMINRRPVADALSFVLTRLRALGGWRNA